MQGLPAPSDWTQLEEQAATLNPKRRL
jgi:hypothetical protein